MYLVFIHITLETNPAVTVISVVIILSEEACLKSQVFWWVEVHQLWNVCILFICCIGRWLRWTSTLSSALKIRIGGSIVKTCQCLRGGVQQTTGSTTHSWHTNRGFETGYILTMQLEVLVVFLLVVVFSCYIHKVWVTNLQQLGKGYGAEMFSLISHIKRCVLCLHCDLCLTLCL